LATESLSARGGPIYPIEKAFLWLGAQRGFYIRWKSPPLTLMQTYPWLNHQLIRLVRIDRRNSLGRLRLLLPSKIF